MNSDKQKVAIITGGSSGLGFAMAKKFTENGITTIITGRNVPKLKDASEALGHNCHTEVLDMANLDLIPGFVKNIQAKYGTVDILVNNAGINQKKDILEVTDEDFKNIIHTNLTSVFSLTREVARIMAHHQKGSIINISSMAAIYGIPKVISYTASKAGIEGMTRALAVDLSPHGIKVNCIAPGFIETPMSAKALDNDPERKARILNRTPMRKLGVPGDVANVAYFLTSEASDYMTGTVIPVDGGNSIGF